MPRAFYPILAYKEHMLMHPMFHINIYRAMPTGLYICVLIHICTYLMFAIAYSLRSSPAHHSLTQTEKYNDDANLMNTTFKEFHCYHLALACPFLLVFPLFFCFFDVYESMYYA